MFFLKNFRIVLLGLLCLVFVSNGSAQTEVAKVQDEKPVGPWTIGGNLRFVSTNANGFNNFSFFNEVDKFNYFSLSPVLSYGITNRTSASLFLGFSTGKQEGLISTFFDNIFIPSRGALENINGFSFGASVDHYVILKDLYGLRLELGAIIDNRRSELMLDESDTGFNFDPAKVINTNTQVVNFFFGPNIDFFIGQRINIVLNMGNIGFVVTSDKDDSNIPKTTRFASTLSPDNIGLGLEFNF